ncbi:hypothetical protein FGLOB1_8192 [Fusarium globosum]|uniref:Uncharacterized protein n=1 Tax=Fusarium globosum TaxID=78864 RepID=A0A8H5Y3M1_9HYPO|nr:hypothetical protein FGLOB1_8192 [Fusarium globosum]
MFIKRLPDHRSPWLSFSCRAIILLYRLVSFSFSISIVSLVAHHANQVVPAIVSFDCDQLPQACSRCIDPAAAYCDVVQQLPLYPTGRVANGSSTIEGELLLGECGPIIPVNTTTTLEFVPIVNITSVTTSWVEHKKISQCIIKRTSTGLAPGPGYSSAPPPPSAPSQQSPPAAGSGGNYNSGQPAPSAPSAGASSAQGSGSQRYVHVDERWDQCPKNVDDLWLTIDLLVLQHLPLPCRHPLPLRLCPGACMEAHLGAILEPQELQLAQVLQELRVPPHPLHL